MRPAAAPRSASRLTARAARVRTVVIAAVLALPVVAGSCGGSGIGRDSKYSPPTKAVRLVFAGDVMLGRGVETFTRDHPYDLFAGIRFELSSADLAMVNLESPLTNRPHVVGPDALEAPPASARLLRSAGIDAVTIANNHAGDAGPETVSDTMRALAAARVTAVGAGATQTQAFAPRIARVGGLRVALLAFDTTMEGPKPADGNPGVARWSPEPARAAVERARSQADVVVVALHGGSPYESGTDPYVMRLGRRLVSWGADIVWAAGPHVVQPVHAIEAGPGNKRPAIVATSLGNLVFDQRIPGTRRGAILEVLVGAEGVRAYRVGTTVASAQPAFVGWKTPRSDAVALDGGWWTLTRPVRPAPVRRPRSLAGFEPDAKVTAAALGDAEGNGGRQLFVSFRRPFRKTKVDVLVPRRRLLDRNGLTAHVGLYRPGSLRPLWVAGTLLRPVQELAVCDGSLAVAYSTLNDSSIAATGAWLWSGFGFTQQSDLTGTGIPACADVDGDGRFEPVILGRSS